MFIHCPYAAFIEIHSRHPFLTPLVTEHTVTVFLNFFKAKNEEIFEKNIFCGPVQNKTSIAFFWKMEINIKHIFI